VIAGLNMKGIEWAFTHTVVDRWAPLTVIAHMFDCQLYGLWAGGHLLTNVLLHTATTILLFLVLWQMTAALWRSAFVAAVFAVHPLHVEAVSWVSVRGDVLCAFFFMLTLGAYVRYVRKPGSSGRYWTVALLLALGLMAKSMLVTLPFVLLLLDYWPLHRFPKALTKENYLPAARRLVVEKIPLFALVIVSSVVTVIAQGKAVTMVEDHSVIYRICNALVSYVIYLRQMVYPAGLAIPYLDPMNHAPVAGAIPAMALLAAISYGAYLCRGKQPWVITGWLWYLGTLVPVIGITQISYYTHADRYTYLPQIGLYILVTWGIADLCVSLRHRQLLLAGLPVAAIVALILCSRIQTSYWHDSETLWQHAIACTTDNYIAHNNLGNALLEKGEVAQAIPHFQKALEIKPEYPEAQNNLGKALAHEGQEDQAISCYQKAIETRPDFAEAQNNLGTALQQKGQADEAIAHYQKAIEIKPDLPELHYGLGNALLRKGEVNEALESYQKALELNPRYAEARYGMGLAFFQNGKVDEAIESYQKAIENNPDYADPENNLGNVLMQKGEVDQAILHYQRAADIKPELAAIRYNLGGALLQKGRIDEAVASYQKAVEIDPNYADADYKLGNLLLQGGHVEQAIPCFQKALQSKPDFVEAHYDLANAFLQKGEESDAIGHFQRVLELQPQNVQAGNNLALLLATSTNGALRNGVKAVELAERANQLSGGGQPVILVALAAAYAETGQFSKAVETAQKALQLASDEGNTELAGTIRGHIKLYQTGTPLRISGMTKHE